MENLATGNVNKILEDVLMVVYHVYMKCSIENCNNSKKYKKYCSTHYWQYWKYKKIITRGTNKNNKNRIETDGIIAKVFVQNNLGVEKDYFLIDHEDIEKVLLYKWNFSESYKYVRSNKCYEKRLHRYLISPSKNMQVDHINRDPTDNRKINLREVTSSQNNYNRRIQSNNISGYKCISWDKNRDKWKVSIKKENKILYSKRFSDIHEAIKFRDAKLKYLWEYR